MKFLYKWLIATLAGAASMLVWGGISHMVLLKGMGFTRMSNEARIVSTLRTFLPGDGLYFFPSIDLRGNPTREERAAWEARFRAGPTGMVVYHAAGDAPVSPRKCQCSLLVMLSRLEFWRTCCPSPSRATGSASAWLLFLGSSDYSPSPPSIGTGTDFRTHSSLRKVWT